jgi:hypothetical protein
MLLKLLPKLKIIFKKYGATPKISKMEIFIFTAVHGLDVLNNLVLFAKNLALIKFMHKIN